MKTTITNSVSFAGLICSQVFAAWAVLVHSPELWAAVEHTSLVVPENIHVYLKFGGEVNNAPVLWYSAWILVLLAGGFVAWRFREVRWPTYLLAICASAQFLWFATMVTRTERFLGTLPSARASLLNDGELEKMRTTFAAIASENAAKVCKRPPLRAGTVLQGNADEHMLALLAKDGAMESCYTNKRQPLQPFKRRVDCSPKSCRGPSPMRMHAAPISLEGSPQWHDLSFESAKQPCSFLENWPSMGSGSPRPKSGKDNSTVVKLNTEPRFHAEREYPGHG